MNQLTLSPGSIVAGFDGSEHAQRALDWAAVQAAREGRPLDLVHVLGADQTQSAVWATASGVEVSTLRHSTHAAAHDLVEKAVGRTRTHHVGLEIRGHVIEADARDTFLDLSQSAHLIVLGSRGRGTIASLLLGSVSSTVSRHAHCPVIVTRQRRDEAEGDTTAGIVVGADGTVDSLPVIEFAFRQASLCALPLTVVHGYPDVAVYPGVAVSMTRAEIEKLRLLMSQSVSGMSEKYPDVAFECRFERGLTHRFLTHDRESWDLIVVGHHRRGMLERAMVGSVAKTVLEHAWTNVAIVPEACTQDDH